MSKRSDSPVSDRFDGSSLDLSEGSCASDMDSDNSRDFNLNSKKFTDYNLIRAEVEEDSNNNNNISNNNEEDELIPISVIENVTFDKNRDVESGNSPECDNSVVLGTTKNSFPLTATSTPKPGSGDCQTGFTQSTETSPVESGNENKTFLIPDSTANKTVCLSNEEIGKKFQDLSFAFKTDSMTIQKRLELMKRRRDQAESNIENEVEIIKTKLKTLQYLGLNSDYVNLMTDLKNQLDFVLNATMQLSSSAEGYGYAQHEEKLLELIAVMLQHVENVESAKMDASKASEKQKVENQRSPTPVFLDGVRDEDKILRRRSIVSQGDCRRRASIATLPRIGSSENGSSFKGAQWTTPSRSCGGAAKKILFPQSGPRSNLVNLPGLESVKDPPGIRLRTDSRASEISMSNIDEALEAPAPGGIPVEELIKEPIESESNAVSDSSLHLKQLFESIEDVRRKSSAQEHLTAAFCLRRLVEWNKILLSSARFRWPENVLHYSSFFVTWYVVFVLVLVFIGGFFTGINGCHTYSCLKYYALWLAAPALFRFTRRFYRFLLPLFLILVIALTVFFFWLTKVLLPQMSNDEVDSLFRNFGLEIRYLHGPPPI